MKKHSASASSAPARVASTIPCRHQSIASAGRSCENRIQPCHASSRARAAPASGPGHAVEVRERAPDPSYGKGVPAERSRLLRLLEGETSCRRRVVGDQVARCLVRGVSQFGLIQVVADVTDALVDLGELRTGDTAQPATGRHRLLVCANGLYVREDVKGAFGCTATEHPRLVPALRFEVVQGQRSDLLVEGDPGFEPRSSGRPDRAARDDDDTASPRRRRHG